MSKENASKFLNKLSSDKEIANQLSAEYQKLICELGKKKGFEFTVEDLQASAKELKKAGFKSLSDEQLDMVTGGSCWQGAPTGSCWEEEPGGPARSCWQEGPKDKIK